MALHDIARKSVEAILSKYCAEKIPERVRGQIRLAFTLRGHRVTLLEERPLFDNRKKWTQHKVAQFRQDPETLEWTLYWARHNARWLRLEEFSPTRNFNQALKEVEANPHGVFWG